MNSGDKLLKAALQQFYRDGYPNTGIRDLCEATDTGKSTFYHYYKSKEDLAVRYIERQTKANVLFLKRLAATSTSPKAFVKKWVGHLKKQCSGGTYFGCPLANLGTQTAWDDVQFKPVLGRSFEELHEVLTGYFKELIGKGRIPEGDPKLLANTALTLYEGAVTLYRSTGDPAYIDGLQQSFALLFPPKKSN